MSSQCQGATQKKITGWDKAIADAREKIKSLQFSIDVFEQNKREGRLWPGDVAGTNRESIPA